MIKINVKYSLEKFNIKHPELNPFLEKVNKLRVGKLSSQLDKSILLYIKKILEIASKDHSINIKKLFEDIYYFGFSFLEEDSFEIIGRDIMALFSFLREAKSIKEASLEVERNLKKYG